jgi:hypothetical protein
MTHVIKVVVACLALAWAAPSHAQSLGDVAKKEETRRKQVHKPGKVYTNETLKPSDRPEPASTDTPSASAAPAPSAPETPAASDSPKRDQKYWHDRMAAAKDGLDRSKSFAEALQSRINALTAEFTGKDDPYQRQVVGQNREKALAELERVKTDITKFEKEIRDTEEEARRAGVPPGWLR